MGDKPWEDDVQIEPLPKQGSAELKPWEEEQRKETEKLPTGGEGFFGDLAYSFAKPAVGAAQLLHKLPEGALDLAGMMTPGPPIAAAQTEGAVTTPKARTEPSEESLGGVAGTMLSTGLMMGAGGAKLFPEATGLGAAALRTGLPGALGGALQPVTDDQNYWQSKALQTGAGMTLGFGMGIAGKPLGAGLNKVADWLRGRGPELLQDSVITSIMERAASNKKYGGIGMEDAFKLMARMRELGKDVTLADIEEIPTLQRLAGKAARGGLEARAIAGSLERRDAGAYGRLQEDISKYIFQGPSARKARQVIEQSQQAAAAPLYEKADALQFIWSGRLQRLMDDSQYVKQGLNRGFRLEREMAAAQDRPFDPTMMGLDFDAEGNVNILRTPNLRVLDMAKRGMDAIIADNRDSITGKLNTEGRTAQAVKTAWVKEIDNLDTKHIYKAARDAWGGPAASKDAIAIGEAAFARSPEENRDLYEALSTGDKEFARLGLASKMRERIAQAGFERDEAKKLINSPGMREQIEPFLSSKKNFDDFVDAVAAETRMKKSVSTILRGSQTAERQAEDFAHPALRLGSAMKMGWSLARGHPLGAVAEGWRLYRDIKRNPDPEFDTEVAKILFAPNLENTPIGMRLLEQMPAHQGVLGPGAMPAAAGAAGALGGSLFQYGADLQNARDIGTTGTHADWPKFEAEARPSEKVEDARPATFQQRWPQSPTATPPADYDYAAAKAAGVKPDERGHLPDTYKLPNHITFSNESVYHGKNDAEGGQWEKLPGGKWMFTPGRTNLQNYSPDQLQRYFQQFEPDSLLNIPRYPKE